MSLSNFLKKHKKKFAVGAAVLAAGAGGAALNQSRINRYSKKRRHDDKVFGGLNTLAGNAVSHYRQHGFTKAGEFLKTAAKDQAAHQASQFAADKLVKSNKYSFWNKHKQYLNRSDVAGHINAGVDMMRNAPNMLKQAKVEFDKKLAAQKAKQQENKW